MKIKLSKKWLLFFNLAWYKGEDFSLGEVVLFRLVHGFGVDIISIKIIKFALHIYTERKIPRKNIR